MVCLALGWVPWRLNAPCTSRCDLNPSYVRPVAATESGRPRAQAAGVGVGGSRTKGRVLWAIEGLSVNGAEQ